MKSKKGIFIPMQILGDCRLNSNEKILLSYYYYYTTQGDMHRCMLPNSTIMEELCFSYATFFRSKQRLKELNLIKTNGGLCVWYIGYNTNNEYQNDTNGGYQDDTKQYQNDTQQYQDDTEKYQNDTTQYQNDTKQYQDDTHNKENKELINKIKKNKGNKERIAESARLSKFNLAVASMLPTYKEKAYWIVENQPDLIVKWENDSNITLGNIVDSVKVIIDKNRYIIDNQSKKTVIE